MSRIGKLPIEIPEGVDVKISSNYILIKGKKGMLEYNFNKSIKIIIKDRFINICINENDKSKKNKAIYGMTRALINNMNIGENNGFKKELEMVGIGYKASILKNKLLINVGYSHVLEFIIPEDIEVVLPQPTKIIINGINKQKVGEFAAIIRKSRPVEPYKGKGIRYLNEHVRRKVGKTGSK